MSDKILMLYWLIIIIIMKCITTRHTSANLWKSYYKE